MRTHISELTPLFIVGSPRSGTTVVMRAIESMGGYFVPHVEGHFLPWLLAGIHKVVQKPRHYPQAFVPTSICTGKNFEVLVECIGEAIDKFMRQVTGAANSLTGNWIDKTPDIHQIRRLPMLQHIFPKSRIVFTTRHPRDVVLSTRNVWNPPCPNTELLLRWNNLHREYRTLIRPYLNTDRVLEIQQEQVVAYPGQVGQALVQFLRITPESENSFVNFFNKRMVNRQTKTRRTDFHYVDQCNSKFLNQVNLICGHEMSYWGYDSPIQITPGRLRCADPNPKEPLTRKVKRHTTLFTGKFAKSPKYPFDP